MTFEEWMRHQGLSLSSVRKYDDAVRRVMSEWAMDNGFIQGSLICLKNNSEFDEIASKIRALPIYKERNVRGHHMYSSAIKNFSKYLSENYCSDIESDIDDILNATNISETEKSNLVKSRIGQGVFRQKIISHWTCCAITGFKDLRLLIASHIKPWIASSNVERLDPFNGLLLTPNLDKAFDQGYITLLPSGNLKISPLLTEPEILGITSNMRISLAPEHEPFLAFHRSEVFRAA